MFERASGGVQPAHDGLVVVTELGVVVIEIDVVLGQASSVNPIVSMWQWKGGNTALFPGPSTGVLGPRPRSALVLFGKRSRGRADAALADPGTG